jgi:hypothetical protein
VRDPARLAERRRVWFALLGYDMPMSTYKAVTTPGRPGARPRAGRRPHPRELEEAQQAATVALTVLRRALVEGAPVTRDAITHEASIIFATNPTDAAWRLDCQAEELGVSSLL